MACNCPKLDKEKGKSGFEPRCAEDVFETFHSVWDHRIKQHLDYINNINDPILKYISVYFVQYYIDGYDYYKNSDSKQRDEACRYLIKWLRKKRDLFTYSGMDKTKNDLWNEKIPDLWKMLMKVYTISSNKVPNSWCNYYEMTHNASFPSWINSPNFEKVISHEHSNVGPPPPPVQMGNPCPPCPGISPETVTPSDTVTPPETDRTKNLAVTSGFTAAGTLGTLFFLYRFTPMMSWFRRPGMNNVGTDLYMNPGGAESFLSMQQDNGSNNIFYQP